MVSVVYILTGSIFIVLALILLAVGVYFIRKKYLPLQYSKINEKEDEIKVSTYGFVIPNHIPKTVKLHEVNGDNYDSVSLNGREIEADMIDPQMYTEEEETDNDDTTLGRICFNLRYDKSVESLIVNLVRGEEIQQRRRISTGSLACPYIKACLLPDKKKKQQTKARRRTSCPLFNEEFIFPCPISGLHERTLQLTVCDFDRFSRQSKIGRIDFPFNNDNIGQILTDEGLEVWREIIDCDGNCDAEVSDKAGELMISLQHLPAAERLTVRVIQGKGIDCANPSKKSSFVHVKMCMIDSGKTVHVRKTAKKSCADPVFNESFHFDIVDGALHHTCFEFIVANNKASLGKAFVGPEMYVTGTGLDHWKSMLQSPRNAVTMWHSLK